MLLISTVRRCCPSGLAGTTWTVSALVPACRSILLYGLVAIALWQAPIFAWLLLVSGWARRATFLWAVLPWLAIGALEKIVFDTALFRPLARPPRDGRLRAGIRRR